MKYEFATLKKSYKPARNWWNTFVLQPVMLPTLWFVANFTRLRPNTISFISFILYLLCGFFFTRGNLVLGAIFFELGVLGDAIDGKLARLKYKPTKFGAYTDTWVDTWGHFIAAITLGIGMFVNTGNHWWLLMGGIMFFIKIQHSIEALMTSNLISPDKYKRVVVGIGAKKEQKGFLMSVRKFLLKRRLRDPLSGSDIKNLLFFVAPLFGILTIMLIIIIPLFLLKAIFWFFYYRNILKKIDGE